MTSTSAKLPQQPCWTSKMLTKNAVLAIGGGVGPSAGVGLHQKIIHATRTDGTDQSHFNIIHISRSPHVQDRTKFLLGEITTNPGEGMAEAVISIKAAADKTGNVAVVAVPCNTFHAPKIWERFVARLVELGADGTTLRLVHMLDETVKLIKEMAPEAKNIGLMSTTGTRQSRVYHDLLEPLGYTVIEVPPEKQGELHDAIYNKSWGIKAVSPVTLKAVNEFRGFAATLKAAGAEIAILGCTEIPLALPEPDFDGMVLVDPVEAAARAMVRMADESKLLPRGGESDHEQVHFHRISAPTTAKAMFKAASVGTHWKKLAHKRKAELENKLKLAHHKEEGAVTPASPASLAAAFVSGIALSLCVSFVFARK